MHRDVTYVTEALRAGALGFVLKNSAGSELLTAMREVMAGRTYVTPLLARRLVETCAGSDAESLAGLPTLTLRQREVLQLFAEGRSAKQVAAALHISPRTAEKHKEHIMAILQVTTIPRNSCNMRPGTASSPTEPAVFFGSSRLRSAGPRSQGGTGERTSRRRWLAFLKLFCSRHERDGRLRPFSALAGIRPVHLCRVGEREKNDHPPLLRLPSAALGGGRQAGERSTMTALADPC